MLEKVSSHINKMQNIGKITTIIEGDVSEELMQSFQAQNYLAGFEAASPKNINSIGESVVVNNYCYICVTDIKDKNYLETVSCQRFRTSGFFFIPKNAKENHINNESNISIDNFLKHIHTKLNRPLAFTALTQFETVKMLCIAKAPIYKENIFENSAEYFPEKTKTTLKNVYGFIIGALSNMNDNKYENINKGLESVLYKNPFEKNIKNDSITSHSHILILSKKINHISEITTDLVIKVGHLIETESIAKSIEAKIYEVH